MASVITIASTNRSSRDFCRLPYKQWPFLAACDVSDKKLIQEGRQGLRTTTLSSDVAKPECGVSYPPNFVELVVIVKNVTGNVLECI